MPWKIQKRDGEYCVIKEEDNSVEKCHPTEKEAKDHMAALYASEEKAELEQWTKQMGEVLEQVYGEESN